MRISGYFHLFPPEHNAGSETTVHAALRAMVRRGHDVNVVCDRSKTAPYEIDGIQVIRPPRRGVQTWMNHYVQDADLLVTHLDLTSQAIGLALDVKKPLVHFIHNPDQLYYWHVEHRIGTAACRLVVMNTDWLAEHYNWPGDQVTVRPVVEPEHYRCERGDSITLVNPTSGKGAPTFYKLARMMPNRSFLTAQGGYGIQEKCQPQNRNLAPHVFYDDQGGELQCFGHPNVTHVRNDPDVRNIFRRTKVLLMPSLAESYGRVAVEAACAGIPTIAHPTLGLKEALGDAGVFIDRDDITSWFEEIERLFTDEIYYRKRSGMALALAETLDPESEFDRLEEAFLETVEKWKHREEMEMAKMWTSDRRLYYDKNKQITTNPNEAVSLCCGIGGRIPEEEAIKLGLVTSSAPPTQAVTVTPELDTKALSEPAENKAISGPEEKKTKGRKSRAA